MERKQKEENNKQGKEQETVSKRRIE